MDRALEVFDRGAVRRHRERAARHGGAEFLFEEAARRLLERLDEVRREFPLAVDLAARRGGLAKRLLGRAGVRTVLALDPSLAMAALARHAAPAAVADMDRLPVATGSADLAIGCLVFHWVGDLPGALLQIRRALKSDGLFLGSLLGGETLIELRHALVEAEAEISSGAAPRVSPTVDLRDAAGLLQRAGFALPVADSDTVTVAYRDAAALMRDLRAMGETNALALRSRRAPPRRLFRRAAEIYAARFAEPSGRIRATFEIVTLTGWAPAASQPKPLRPGSAAHRLAEALGAIERPAGEKAGS